MRQIAYLVIIALLISCGKDGSGDNGGTTIDGWTITTVDDVILPDNDISVACDDNDKIHVCYIDDDVVKYANNKSGSWSKETLIEVTGDLMVMGFNDLAVDGNNHVHMVYATETNTMNTESKIYYATDKSGTMVKEEVFSTLGSISGMGIVATSTGKVHIVYSDPNFRIKYIHNLTGSWSSIQDLGSYWTGVRPRIALDSDENVYVVYEHGGEGVLRLQVINSSGSPVSNNVVDGVIDSGEDTGWSPDIAINTQNNSRYIVYYNDTDEEMMFYYNGTIIPIEISSWSHGSVAMDPDGNPHIVFRNTDALRYGVGDGDSFTVSTLPDETHSTSNGIVVDSNGKVYIIYFSGSDYKLKMMTK